MTEYDDDFRAMVQRVYSCIADLVDISNDAEETQMSAEDTMAMFRERLLAWREEQDRATR